MTGKIEFQVKARKSTMIYPIVKSGINSIGIYEQKKLGTSLTEHAICQRLYKNICPSSSRVIVFLPNSPIVAIG